MRHELNVQSPCLRNRQRSLEFSLEMTSGLRNLPHLVWVNRRTWVISIGMEATRRAA